MISFVEAQGPVKIRMPCSKVLLLINYFDSRSWNSFKNTCILMVIQRRQIFPFYKGRCSKCSLEIKLFIKENQTGVTWVNLLYIVLTPVLLTHNVNLTTLKIDVIISKHTSFSSSAHAIHNTFFWLQDKKNCTETFADQRTYI